MIHYENLKISIVFIKVAWPRYTPLWLAMHRTLRERYHIFDILPLQMRPMPNDPDRFVIEVWLSLPEKTAAGVAGENLSSFGVIPTMWSEKYSLTFKVIAPGGEEKAYIYSYTERSYSWGLILGFFGPGFGHDLNTEWDLYQDDRIVVFDKLTTRFMSDAAPFISSHRSPAAP
jgi:hypothetical protein